MLALTSNFASLSSSRRSTETAAAVPGRLHGGPGPSVSGTSTWLLNIKSCPLRGRPMGRPLARSGLAALFALATLGFTHTMHACGRQNRKQKRSKLRRTRVVAAVTVDGLKPSKCARNIAVAPPAAAVTGSPVIPRISVAAARIYL